MSLSYTTKNALLGCFRNVWFGPHACIVLRNFCATFARVSQALTTKLMRPANPSRTERTIESVRTERGS